jgi:myo-inositol-1(or 4)-monophosphatase
MPLHSALITIMEKAARKAAPRLRRDFNEVEALQVSRKGVSDFVSNADRAAEATIREILTHARPDWGLLMEQARWIVDPLDGTTNFLHGIPHFAVSIAAEVHGEVVAGLVYQPLTDESFWAEKGKGAWLQDRRLRVSVRKELPDCVFATGIPFNGHGDVAQFEKLLSTIMPQVAGIRRFGAAALDLAWVAAGRYDGYFESHLNLWDVAAGILLVREAGGFVTDFRGGDKPIERAEIVAGNDQIHSKLHRLVAGALR